MASLSKRFRFTKREFLSLLVAATGFPLVIALAIWGFTGEEILGMKGPSPLTSIIIRPQVAT